MPEPWYVEGFGRHYLDLYAHRNEREAHRALELLAGAGVELAGRRVLDLGCGAGRHLAALRRRGAQAFGLDRSWPLLDEGRRRLAPPPGIVRGDMRHLPFADGAFAGLLSMFTSFGYFRADAENWGVLAEVARVLAPGGFFLFDFLNRRQVERELRAESTRETERWLAEETRRIDDDRVRKAVRIVDRASGEEVQRYEESVRLFTPGEIAARLAGLGLVEAARWGDYAGAPFDEAASPRFLVLSRRETGP